VFCSSLCGNPCFPGLPRQGQPGVPTLLRSSALVGTPALLAIAQQAGRAVAHCWRTLRAVLQLDRSRGARQKAQELIMLRNAFCNEPSSPVALKLLGPGEPRAPAALLSTAKRAALIACLTDGTLYKRRGAWTSPSDADRRIASITIANLARDGMLTLSLYGRRGVAHLTARGSWFARTIASASS
jgi:hypothetical protein